MGRAQAALDRRLAPTRRNSHGDRVEQERVAGIQRARILTAMAEVCAERGAANVTVAHVVGRSGVSRRTFYELFVDREDCLLEALEEALACVKQYVLPVYDAEGSWRERIRTSLIAALRFLDDEPFLGHLMMVETLGAGARALARRRQVLARIVAAVDEGRDEIKAGKGPPPLAAEGVVGGVLSVLHSRLLDRKRGSLLELTGPLMGMIVLPYVGSAAAENELQRPVPRRQGDPRPSPTDPLRDLEMRLTYRTVRVLTSVAANPGSSNREVGVASGIQDQGQISKLMTRLDKLGLVQNTGVGSAKGAPNAWTLTHRGHEVEQALGQRSMPEERAAV